MSEEVTGPARQHEHEPEHKRGPEHDSAPPPNADSTGGMPAEKDPNQLSPEEQLRRYEEALKNDDWGHQPC